MTSNSNDFLNRELLAARCYAPKVLRSFQFADDFEEKHLADAKSFHQHFCRVLADKLGLPNRLEAYWKLHELSIAQRCNPVRFARQARIYPVGDYR